MNENIELYRQLVTLARSSEMAHGDFRQSLIASGLRISQASVLMLILRNHEVAAEFTLVDPNKRIGFRAALNKARRTSAIEAECRRQSNDTPQPPPVAP